MGLFEQLGEILKPENFLKVELSDYCPECYCTVHKDEWEVSFTGTNEFIHCPGCNYREQINGVII